MRSPAARQRTRTSFGEWGRNGPWRDERAEAGARALLSRHDETPDVPRQRPATRGHQGARLLPATGGPGRSRLWRAAGARPARGSRPAFVLAHAPGPPTSRLVVLASADLHPTRRRGEDHEAGAFAVSAELARVWLHTRSREAGAALRPSFPWRVRSVRALIGGRARPRFRVRRHLVERRGLRRALLRAPNAP